MTISPPSIEDDPIDRGTVYRCPDCIRITTPPSQPRRRARRMSRLASAARICWRRRDLSGGGAAGTGPRRGLPPRLPATELPELT